MSELLQALTSLYLPGSYDIAAEFRAKYLFRIVALQMKGRTEIDALGVVLILAIPVSIFVGLAYGLNHYLVRQSNTLHTWLMVASADYYSGDQIPKESSRRILHFRVFEVVADVTDASLDAA